MTTLLDHPALQPAFSALRTAQRALAANAAPAPVRQPVHVLYGGAHLFSADSPGKLGQLALRSFDEQFPDAAALGAALGLGPAAVAVHARVREKLSREPIEDLRVDFEDGYGVRPDEEEDEHARRVGLELARGLEAGSLPPFVGVRIKSLTSESAGRAARTLDLVLSGLLDASRDRIPDGFVVTLPKVSMPEEVAALAALLAWIEVSRGLPARALRLEIMVESPLAIVAADGSNPLRRLVAAGDGRCGAAHFGTYDYTAACDVTAAWQTPDHPAAVAARAAMQAGLAGTGVWLADGATTVLPIGRHRAEKGGAGLTQLQIQENRATVLAASKLHFDHVRRALREGFYAGWDLHPAQLPARYAAVYSFFLEGLEPSRVRLAGFLARAAQATRAGEQFDDAATGQGLLNFFLRGLSCGAFGEAEARSAGLTIDELRTRSFATIVQGRR